MFSYFQAFAWFSDLLVEHSEIFWSLFAVDMDNILAEQPPDTWDSFPLFQILNDYLRTDGELNSVKNHNLKLSWAELALMSPGLQKRVDLPNTQCANFNSS